MPLADLNGTDLTEAQLAGLLAEIDQAVLDLLAADPEPVDRATYLEALLSARRLYQTLIQRRPTWETTTV